MQIHRLSGSKPRRWSAQLHPRLTIVHGLPPEVASPLRAAVDALVRARTSGPGLAVAGLGGRVVVDGREIPLEEIDVWAPGLVASPPRTYGDLVGPPRLLGAARARALEVEVDAAAVALGEAEADLARVRERWSAAHEAQTSRVADGWRTRADAARALRRARRRSADAVAVVSEAAVAVIDRPPPAVTSDLRGAAEERLDAARTALAAATTARAEAEALRDRALVADEAVEEVALRSAELDRVERELAQAPAPRVATPEERRAVVHQRAQLVHDIAQIELAPTERVANALEGAGRGGSIATVEAAQVAVEWERVRDLVADQADPESGADASAPGREVARPVAPTPAAAPAVDPVEAADRVRRARDRVEGARRALARATSSSGPHPAELEALEAAHAEVLSVWEGSERRVGGDRARRRLEDAQLAEREILNRLGFVSYTEFMVSEGPSGPSSLVDGAEAERTLADAEAHLATLEAEAASVSIPDPPSPDTWSPDPTRGRMTATLDALRARAADLLGGEPGEDVAAHLRERIATDPVSDLRLALDEVGLPLGEILARDEILARARAWLAQQEGAAARRATLVADRVKVDEHLARLDAADAARAERNALARRRDKLRADVAARVAVAGAVDAAEARVARDRDVEQRAEAELAEAEVSASEVDPEAANVAAPGPADAPDVSGHEPRPDPPADDLAALGSHARDAQTALDAAVSHLLAPRDDEATIQTDVDLGRAEARVELARRELEGLERVRVERATTGADGAVDVETLTWRVLAQLAAHRAAAIPGGPGPTPLMLDDPFGPVDGDVVARVCDALVGPSSIVQTVLFTARPEVTDWLDGIDDQSASLVSFRVGDDEGAT